MFVSLCVRVFVCCVCFVFVSVVWLQSCLFDCVVCLFCVFVRRVACFVCVVCVFVCLFSVFGLS